jgi:hypothetical protein
MLQRLATIVLAVTVCISPSPAFARGHGGGHNSYGGGHHSYGGYHSRGGRIYGFRTSKCRSASCFRKHPNGTYVHPLTERKHR